MKKFGFAVVMLLTISALAREATACTTFFIGSMKAIERADIVFVGKLRNFVVGNPSLRPYRPPNNPTDWDQEYSITRELDRAKQKKRVRQWSLAEFDVVKVLKGETNKLERIVWGGWDFLEPDQQALYTEELLLVPVRLEKIDKDFSALERHHQPGGNPRIPPLDNMFKSLAVSNGIAKVVNNVGCSYQTYFPATKENVTRARKILADADVREYNLQN